MKIFFWKTALLALLLVAGAFVSAQDDTQSGQVSSQEGPVKLQEGPNGLLVEPGFDYEGREIDAGIQMIVASKKVATFEQAKPFVITQRKDGEPAYVYIRFNRPISYYVFTKNRSTDLYKGKFLSLKVGDRKDTRAPGYSEDRIFFKDKDPRLNQKELVVALSPIQNYPFESSRVWLETVGGGNPGVWDNELRLVVRVIYFENDSNEMSYITNRAPLTANVGGGIGQYKSQWAALQKIITTQTTAKTAPEKPGLYKNPKLQKQALDYLKVKKGITPKKFYFIQDQMWVGQIVEGESRHQYMWAEYTFKKGADCMIGLIQWKSTDSPVTRVFEPLQMYVLDPVPMNCKYY